jgi:acetyl-CoA acetyltransferase
VTQRQFSGQVAIAGAATAGIGWDTSMSVAEIMAEAANKALEDAGLSVRDVDGLFAVTPYYWMASATLADQLGIQPKVTDSTNIGGASVVAHVGHAVRAIVAGQCEVAVIAYASTQRSDSGKLVTGADLLPYERPYGPLFPISGYAMVMQRHMYEFGTTREQLAKVAVAASQWAALNPEALKPEPLTVAGRARIAAGQRSAAQARHLPRHQRRRGDRADQQRAREEAEEAGDPGARAPARATAIVT